MPATPSRPGTPSLLRAINDRAALDLLLARGPLSRAELGRLAGLSKPTASQLLARLEAARLVVPAGTSSGRPGPGAALYRIHPGAAHVAGLDVTPTRILAAVADITGTVLAEHRLPTAGRRAGRTVERVAEALDTALGGAGLTRDDLHRVVIGTPGALDPGTGRLRYAPHLSGWHSPRLLEELADGLRVPVGVENDVNLAAVAEQRVGQAQGVDDFVLLWADEGVGAAVVIAGRLHRGHTGGAGEVGPMPMPGAPVARDVRRENSGGFQELVGAPAVRSLGRDHGVTGRTAADVVATARRRAGTGDEAATAFLGTLAQRIATGLAAIVAVVDPELVLLCGGIPTSGGEPLRALVAEGLTGLAVPRPRLLLSGLTGSPVVTGALQTALAAVRDEVFTTR